MRDKILIRAIIISIAVHVVAVSFVGRSSSTRLNAASAAPVSQRLLNVDLVKDPLAEPPKPKPVAVEAAKQIPPPPRTRANPVANAAPRLFAGNSSPVPTRTPSHPVRIASNAGGALNTGTASSQGDLRGMNTGRTPVGWVPGNGSGRGQGSGSGPGVGNPEPPRADPPRHVDPAPPPPPPPAPRRVIVRVCEVSGLLAGPHCKGTRNESFNEGAEPRRTCERCRAPEPAPVAPRLADRKNPFLKHDVAPRVPDSVDDGVSLTVEVEYWVDTDGGVSGVTVARSSGNRDFDRNVCSAASRWRYDPAVQDGVPRRVKMSRTIRTT